MVLKSNKGQTTIELLILLSVSMVALTIIFSIYINQINSSYNNQDYFLAKSSVQKIVSAANTIYYSGPGSEIKVEFDFPRDTDFSSTGFFGPDLLLKLKNGSTYVGGADVNVVGLFKPISGKNVIYMFYDGNVVRFHYDTFEINKQNISLVVVKGENVSTNFTIRNNSMDIIKFYIDKNFSHDSVNLAIEPIDSFTLNPAELKQINLEFTQSSVLQGNYSGYILVTGEVNDSNFSRKINVSLEVITKSNDLVIYPKINSFSSQASTTTIKSFSICNSGQNEMLINNWGANGSVDKNAALWILELPNISRVSPRDCNNFDITFEVGVAISDETYDANIFAVFNDSNSVSSQVFITIID